MEILVNKLEKENQKLKKEIELLKVYVQELTETNDHLITATWRERELKQKLQETQLIIEEQNKNITASINYSLKIQKSIIPTNEDIKRNFKDSFIYYKPKDVVSGDFPWYFKKGDYTYFAAVDCTGHGVPGAMLAIIGSLLLNDIVNDEGFLKPGLILDKLHKSIVKILKQELNRDAANDGLDIALCRINNQTNELLYAGAHRPLYHFTDGVMNRIKGDSYPIGGCQYDKNRKPFKDNVVQLKEGDGIFVFSDGLPDQFGGDEDDKYGTGFMNDYVLDMMINNTEMEEIEIAVHNNLKSWQGNTSQLDDILLIGVKI